MRFVPTPLHVMAYSQVAMALVMLSVLLGLAAGFALGRRPARRLLFWLIAGLFLAAALLHLAGIFTLLRDPERGLGYIPLPSALVAGVNWLLFVFVPVSPGLAAFTLTRVFRALPPVCTAVRVAVAVVSTYAVAVGGWAVFVLLD